MNKKNLSMLCSAVFGAIALANGAQAMEEKSGASEKCFGVSKAGENACASANGSHSCSAQSSTAYSGQEFKNVPKGTCEKMKGSLKPFEGKNPKIDS